jgi:GNAT superfamily N-acetyltransferase
MPLNQEEVEKYASSIYNEYSQDLSEPNKKIYRKLCGLQGYAYMSKEFNDSVSVFSTGIDFKWRTIELELITIKKEFRNQGYGSKLIKLLIELCDEIEFRLVLVPDENFGGELKRLEKFYASFGFRKPRRKTKGFQEPYHSKWFKLPNEE